ncbi:MAG: TIGR00159 family protein [Deltaproteobacteria bacterium GWA2_38_16]|nr:MAG: TIGR00159 family protein [Deltaproteobacteria bacterium GWA2_38_16]OGQ03065.1 MAG: TIGR00159 family protein [Deltaproteobacteria bacterium RIFCSPHIGHO2_02_FULL_38_15]OGQ34964.1 MAG: TIGR00159 family protein [Deltaproteobacteria bacterium RIFCSPLOWO2_01_FULL_38_9]OGQ61839.1 MAG: TIGR00159 family protein [Deltaproteobacteria bacterium RIFCSPLOWO2_12_FULL_38_8]HBQ20518.1 TIGR00159 family protein [Deltaproteobacteria bacterium]
MEHLPPILQHIRWQDAVDFLIIFYLIYRALLLIKGTRAIQMLTGFGIVIVIFLLSKNFGFYTLYVLLKELLSPLVIIIIIIFQDDIRRALAHVGKNPFFSGLSKIEDIHVIDEILKAAFTMAERRLGGIIVIERETGLKNFIEEGVKLDAKVDSDLLFSIFLPYGPIHDGAVIIQGGRMTAGGCFLPSSQATNLPKQYGSRHRAALGLSEQTDALVIAISEETSEVSLFFEGKVKKGLDQYEMSKLILELLEKNLGVER